MMLFISITFAIFFVLVLILYRGLRHFFRSQNLMLLVASYVFYGYPIDPDRSASGKEGASLAAEIQTLCMQRESIRKRLNQLISDVQKKVYSLLDDVNI
jgi:hypothetical protein